MPFLAKSQAIKLTIHIIIIIITILPIIIPLIYQSSLSIYQSINPSVYQPIYLSIYLSISLSIRLYVCMLCGRHLMWRISIRCTAPTDRSFAKDGAGGGENLSRNSLSILFYLILFSASHDFSFPLIRCCFSTRKIAAKRKRTERWYEMSRRWFSSWDY